IIGISSTVIPAPDISIENGVEMHCSLSITSPFQVDGPLVWLNPRGSGSEKCISTPFSIDISGAGITVELIPIIRELTQHFKVFRPGK
ncbi:MAG: hypothetical protein RLO18_14955, partial [Gimesia chilikensis]